MSGVLERFKERVDAFLKKSEELPPTIFKANKEIYFLKSSNDLTDDEERVIANFQIMVTGLRDSHRLDDDQMKAFEKIVEIQSSYSYKN